MDTDTAILMTNINGARKAILISIAYALRMNVTSVVSLVTRLPVENLSTLANEKLCIFSKSEARRFFAKPMEATAANRAESAPATSAKNAYASIMPPCVHTAFISPNAIPSSTSLPISRGINTSKTTSAMTNKGASTLGTIYPRTFSARSFRLTVCLGVLFFFISASVRTAVRFAIGN